MGDRLSWDNHRAKPRKANRLSINSGTVKEVVRGQIEASPNVFFQGEKTLVTLTESYSLEIRQGGLLTTLFVAHHGACLSLSKAGRILDGMPKRTVSPPIPPLALQKPIPPLKPSAQPVKRLKRGARAARI
jgi:hypothetical protein